MTEIIDVSPISEKGQVTIPKEIRDLLKLMPGDKIAFVSKGKDILVKKVKTKRLSELFTSQKPLGVDSLSFQRKLRDE